MKLLIICPLIFLAIVRTAAQQACTSDSLQENWFSLSREEIYSNEEKMRHRQNLSIFEEGHRQGFFYFLHPALPRYAPYLEFPEFEGLVERDRQLYDMALERSSTLYHLELPAGFNPECRYPLMIIFHGGNSNFHKVKKHWNEEVSDKQFIKVYLQSYRHFDSESFSWRSGDKRADSDLQNIYQEVLGALPVDSSRVILCGISAGANYAIGMALRGVLPVNGILAFCPGLPQVLRSAANLDGLRSDITVFMVGGEHDFYRESQHKLCEFFDKLNIPYHYRLVEGMGHQYPENEASYIREGLRYILRE